MEKRNRLLELIKEYGFEQYRKGASDSDIHYSACMDTCDELWKQIQREVNE